MSKDLIELTLEGVSFESSNAIVDNNSPIGFIPPNCQIVTNRSGYFPISVPGIVKFVEDIRINDGTSLTLNNTVGSIRSFVLLLLKMMVSMHIIIFARIMI